MSIFSTCNSYAGDSMVLESVDVLEEGVFKYTPSMIPVLAKNTVEGTKYLVEFDMLQKLAEHNYSDICEAFYDVVSENGIDSDNLYVFVSENTAEYINESEMNDFHSNVVDNIKSQVNSLVNNGINIVKSNML